MKTLTLSLAALTAFAIMITSSCDSSSSKLDKFMGTWKRVDKVDDNITIKKEDDAILLIQNKDTVVGRYDKKSNALKFWVLSTGVITHNEKNDHLLLKMEGNLLFNTGGKDGEFKRVK
jgi:hypothetical protein